MLGVLDHLGIERAHVVGHDWGAALAWALAAFAPERVDHLAVLSVGHPGSFRGAGFEQREKSWYMLLFQFEGVAEQWLSNNDFANLRAWSRHPEVDDAIAGLARPARAHGEPELVPSEPPTNGVDRTTSRDPCDLGADAGHLEQR